MTTKSATMKFQATMTASHAIALPTDVCRELDIEPGDAIELELIGDAALIRKQSNEPVTEEPRKPASELRGLLSDYFTDREDVQRFIEEERRG